MNELTEHYIVRAERAETERDRYRDALQKIAGHRNSTGAHWGDVVASLRRTAMDALKDDVPSSQGASDTPLLNQTPERRIDG